MRTGHDVARKAVQLWQREHPGKSLADQCQRYAGYYCLWSGFETEGGIAGYGSAIEAYRASKIESKDPMTAPPGAMHYFDIGKYGHIGFALGSGLMAHTSALGDTIENLGSHVKISTVKSYPYKYLGWSKANGTKPSLVGKLSDANKQPLAPNQRRTKNYVVAGRAYANLRDDAIALMMPPNTLLTIKSWRVGDTTHSEKRFLLTTYQGKQVYVHLGDVTPQNVEGIPPFPVTEEPDPTPEPPVVVPEPTPEPEPEPEPTPEPEEPNVPTPVPDISQTGDANTVNLYDGGEVKNPTAPLAGLLARFTRFRFWFYIAFALSLLTLSLVPDALLAGIIPAAMTDEVTRWTFFLTSAMTKIGAAFGFIAASNTNPPKA